MRTIIILGLVVAGYFGYKHWSDVEAPAPAIEAAAIAQIDEPLVEFAIKRRVKRILDE